MTGGSSSKRRPGGRLGRSFFDRPTVRVAQDLLGATVTVTRHGTARTARIVETEAYISGDRANHAFGGRTRRNASMFLSPGTLYVFRIHQVVCANLVTRAGEAVLLRAAEPVTPSLGDASGPGRLCRALGITHGDDGVDATRGTKILVRGRSGRAPEITVGPRVGLRRAVRRPLRFMIRGHRSVSRPRRAGGGPG